MRKDDLEDFIINNRKSFNDIESVELEPVWENISTRLGRIQLIGKVMIWTVVTTLGVLLVVCLCSILAQNKSFETIAGLTEEQQGQRDKMIQFVNQKEDKLKEKNIDISQLSEFANELKGLDEIEQLIVGDFPQTVNKEKLVKSMLQYYESKARILELILLEIENKEKNEIFEKEIY